VAALAVLLASDEAEYMTGTELTIDGGILAGSAAMPGSWTSSGWRGNLATLNTPFVTVCVVRIAGLADYLPSVRFPQDTVIISGGRAGTCFDPRCLRNPLQNRSRPQMPAPLEGFVTKTRDKKAALKFLRKAIKKHGKAEVLATDKLRSYGAALMDLGAADRQEMGRWRPCC
jgi:hypothetical protein